MSKKRILNKVVSFRTNTLWLSWLDDLAAKTGRSPGALLRDLVYCVATNDDLTVQVSDRLESQALSYSRFARQSRG